LTGALLLLLAAVGFGRDARAQHGIAFGISGGGVDFASEYYPDKWTIALDGLYSYSFKQGSNGALTANLLWNFFWDSDELLGPSPAHWDETDALAVKLRSIGLVNLQYGYPFLKRWFRLHAGGGLGLGLYDMYDRESYNDRETRIAYANWTVTLELLALVPKYVWRPVLKYINFYSLDGHSELNGSLWLFTIYMGD